MDFSNINYFAVLVAGLISFGIGALWYSPILFILFGKTWQKELGLTTEDLEAGGAAGMVKTFGGSLVLMVVMVFGLAAILEAQVGSMNALTGLKTGLFTGILFSATSMGINYLYQRKSLTLFLIDAVYQVAFMGVSGVVLAIWR